MESADNVIKKHVVKQYAYNITLCLLTILHHSVICKLCSKYEHMK